MSRYLTDQDRLHKGLPFGCDNCPNKPTVEDVIRNDGSCEVCGDSIVAYTVDAAKFIEKLQTELDKARAREKRLESEIEHYIQAVGKYCERDEIHRKNWLKAEDECKALRARLERAVGELGDIAALSLSTEGDNHSSEEDRKVLDFLITRAREVIAAVAKGGGV